MRALGVAALALLAQCAHGGSGAMAVGGFGVRMPALAAQQQTPLEVADVAEVTARILGAELAPRVGDDAQLPTGDLFARPKACLVVVVDGVDAADLGRVKDAPMLSEMFAEGAMPVETSGASLEDALSAGGARLGELVNGQFASSLVLAASQDKGMAEAAGAKVTLHEDGTGLDSELELFRKVPARLSPAKVADASPDLIVLGVSSLRAAGAADKGLGKLDRAVSDLVRELSEVYGERLAVQVVLLGDASASTGGRKLAGELDVLKIQALTIASQDTNTFLLHIWVSVAIFFLLFMVFVCMPWADELDPLLYSSLARENVKRD